MTHITWCHYTEQGDAQQLEHTVNRHSQLAYSSPNCDSLVASSPLANSLLCIYV